MPRFRVTVRQDAYLNHFAEIEADNAKEAADRARRAWKEGDETVTFQEDDYSTFDDVTIDPEECEEIDDEGCPVWHPTPEPNT